jgi:hypothetical protein
MVTSKFFGNPRHNFSKTHESRNEGSGSRYFGRGWGISGKGKNIEEGMYGDYLVDDTADSKEQESFDVDLRNLLDVSKSKSNEAKKDDGPLLGTLMGLNVAIDMPDEMVGLTGGGIINSQMDFNSVTSEKFSRMI